MKHLPAILLAIVIAVFIWSGIGPHDRWTWYAEVAPVIIALPLLFFTRHKFPLTPLLYTLIAIHCIVLLVGGHYTYALTPIGDWLREPFGFERNHYDRLGHLMQGFVPAMIARELLLRTSTLKAGKWMFAIIVLSCFGISAIYELIEWQAAILTGTHADQFLATQGDVWDTQKDMLCAGIGAIIALLTLSRYHNRQLSQL